MVIAVNASLSSGCSERQRLNLKTIDIGLE